MLLDWAKPTLILSSLTFLLANGGIDKRATLQQDILTVGEHLTTIIHNLDLEKRITSKESKKKIDKLLNVLAKGSGPFAAVFAMTAAIYGSGSSPEQEAIENLGKEMNARFDEVDKKLDELSTSITTQLGDMTADLTLVNIMFKFNTRADSIKLRKDTWMTLLSNTTVCRSCDETDLKSYCSQKDGYPTDIAKLLAADLDHSRNEVGRYYLIDYLIKTKFNREATWKMRDRIEAAFTFAYLLIPACAEARYTGITEAEKLARIAKDQTTVEQLFKSTMESVNNDIVAAFETKAFRFEFWANKLTTIDEGWFYDSESCSDLDSFQAYDFECEITLKLDAAYYTKEGNRRSWGTVSKYVAPFKGTASFDLKNPSSTITYDTNREFYKLILENFVKIEALVTIIEEGQRKLGTAKKLGNKDGAWTTNSATQKSQSGEVNFASENTDIADRVKITWTVYRYDTLL